MSQEPAPPTVNTQANDERRERTQLAGQTAESHDGVFVWRTFVVIVLHLLSIVNLISNYPKSQGPPAVLVIPPRFYHVFCTARPLRQTTHTPAALSGVADGIRRRAQGRTHRDVPDSGGDACVGDRVVVLHCHELTVRVVDSLPHDARTV